MTDYFNAYSLAPFLVAAISFALGLFIYSVDPKSHLNRVFLYVTCVISFWLIASARLLTSLNQNEAYFWGRVLFSAIALAPAVFFHLSVVLTNNYPRQKNILRLVYFQSALVALLVWNRLFFSGISHGFFGIYPQAGMLLPVLVISQEANFFISLMNFVHEHFQQNDPDRRRESRFFMIVFLLLQISFMDIFTAYDATIYPAGYIVLLGFLLILICYFWRKSQARIQKALDEYEGLKRIKASEESKILEELRATQLKLIETGKVSSLASLSAGILHQISQPITAIHGFVRFIKKEMKPQEEFYKPICLMEEQSVYLKEMIEDLMNLIRHREIKKENINVNDVVKKSMNLIADEMRIRRVHWDMELKEGLPMIFADSIHLQQIFMNIVINALEALSNMPHGLDRRIKVSTRFNLPNNEIHVLFQDNGPGLTVTDKSKIFDPFFSTKTSGSGIGLALSWDLITEHGGTIEVESSPKAGATFIVKLPCVKNQG